VRARGTSAQVARINVGASHSITLTTTTEDAANSGPPTITCLDAEYVPPERTHCACMVGVKVGLEVEQVRACFEGHPLSRGEAIAKLQRERRARLFPPPTRSRCGIDHSDAAARLVIFARELNIPAPSAEMEDQQPKLAQARRRARHAVERLTWHEVRRLVLAMRKFGDLAPTERANKIRSIATDLWLRRGERPR